MFEYKNELICFDLSFYINQSITTINMKIIKLFKLCLIPFALTGIISCSTTQSNETIFNGKDLSGWVQRGGAATYKVVDGAIVGTSVWDSPNSFLCTKKNYSDFVLEFEVKVDEPLNSGVQFRSNSYDSVMDGRVHGYQCEIDPSERSWSGGIYDEARRGWLYPLSFNPDAFSAFKNGEWNKFKIQAIGNHIQTWINGVAIANLYDDMTSEGFIALQVHAINDSASIGKQISWRNINLITNNLNKYETDTTPKAPILSRLVNQLVPEEEAQGWKLLFDGKTADQWRGAHKDSFPANGWKIGDGILTVLETGGAEAQAGGDIVTKGQFSAFDLQLEFMITPGANSGIKYYVTENEQSSGSSIGPEYQILDDNLHPDAKLGSQEGSRTLASLYDLIKAKDKRFEGPGIWASARVLSDGTVVSHWLNGIKVLEYNRYSEHFDSLVAASKYKVWKDFGKAEKGHILLQDHGNTVSFRSIKIKELK